MKLNKKKYLDKLHAAWLGKNIGGTLGGPYECTREFVDLKGFTTPAGEPLPNDDLDLQLVWLCALESVGPKAIDANLLGEYWLDWIGPHWNEYGVAKTNLRLGLLPPMSGEVDNDRWKTSNGAWIRSEIWASIAPGAPDVAARFASYDAMVDHGVSEGTSAEIFTAAMQSAAYVESDIRKLIECALSKVSPDSMIAKTVRLVIESYDKGVDYRTVRENIVELNKSLGWFQAPANIGYVVIGLLYGEGDFKRSMTYAINCGDDTDCTGATVGATLGIIGGVEGIPADWREFVGDKIVTVAINGMYYGRIPKTCANLTARVAALVADAMKAGGVAFEFTDGEDEFTEHELESYNKLTDSDILSRGAYSYDINSYPHLRARVELDGSPRIAPQEERLVKLTFYTNPCMPQTHKMRIRAILPEGFTVRGMQKTLSIEYLQPALEVPGKATMEFTVAAGENVEAENRIYIEVTSTSFARAMMIPITLIG